MSAQLAQIHQDLQDIMQGVGVIIFMLTVICVRLIYRRKH